MDTTSTPIKFDIYEGNALVRTEILAEQTIKIGKLSSSHVRIDDDSYEWRAHGRVLDGKLLPNIETVTVTRLGAEQ